MNQLELQTRRNNIRRLFRHQSGIHVNCVRINSGNTYEHERAKFEECWKLAKLGKEFLTEAETPDKSKRADIVCLDEGYIIEIVNTESEESLIRKSKVYPLPIVIVRVKGDVA